MDSAGCRICRSTFIFYFQKPQISDSQQSLTFWLLSQNLFVSFTLSSIFVGGDHLFSFQRISTKFGFLNLLLKQRQSLLETLQIINHFDNVQNSPLKLSLRQWGPWRIWSSPFVVINFLSSNWFDKQISKSKAITDDDAVDKWEDHLLSLWSMSRIDEPGDSLQTRPKNFNLSKGWTDKKSFLVFSF